MHTLRFITQPVDDALNECQQGQHVSHIQRAGRIVAVRPQRIGQVPKQGYFHLSFSDPKIDHRPRGNDEKPNLSRKQAHRLIRTFLYADTTVHRDITEFDQFINQATREVSLIKKTPTRIQLEYDLPNSGTVTTWRYYLDLGTTRYLSLD